MRLLPFIFSLFFSCYSFALKAYYDVVISGAGPAGIAAAHAVVEAGGTVLVVEKRPFDEWGARDRIVAIDEIAMIQAQKLCHCDIPFSKLSRFVVNSKFSSGVVNANFASQAALSLLIGREFGGTIKIGLLEKSLYEPGVERGVDFTFESKIEEISKGFVNLNINGKRKKISTELLIDAEGAHSALLTKMGIGRRKQGFPQVNCIVGNFDAPGTENGEYRVEFTRNPAHPFYALALVSNGVATIYASPYSGTLKGQDVGEIVKKSARLFGITGKYHGDATNFVTDIDYAERTSDFSQKFLVIGDAAKKADPLTGYGITTALNDAQAVLELTRSLKRNGSLNPWDFQKFDMAMKKSTDQVKAHAKKFHEIRFWVKSPLGDGPISIAATGMSIIGSLFGPAPSCRQMLE